jgi:3-oxoacyl-[acyl-carrier protein] reductase
MELGVAGRKAVVCASSKGLGFACAASLAGEGVEVVVNGRDPDRLLEAATEIQKLTGRAVTTIAADINTEEGRGKLIDACPDADILINNNSGPPPRDFLDVAYDDWLDAFAKNALPALTLIKAFLPGMKLRKFGRIINITSAMVKSPSPSMETSTASRAALTAASKALSRTVAPFNVTINNLLPERFDTDRQLFMAQRMMKQSGISLEEARAQIVATIPAGRFGRLEEFGDMCAFLCSRQAGFVTGQNVQLDGGAYKGLV